MLLKALVQIHGVYFNYNEQYALQLVAMRNGSSSIKIASSMEIFLFDSLSRFYI